MPKEHSFHSAESLKSQQVDLQKQLRDLANLLQTAQNQERQSRSPEWNQQISRLLEEISGAMLSVQSNQSYEGRNIEELKKEAGDLLLPLS